MSILIIPTLTKVDLNVLYVIIFNLENVFMIYLIYLSISKEVILDCQADHKIFVHSTSSTTPSSKKHYITNLRKISSPLSNQIE